MPLFSKILIPIDFEERCRGAARFAIPLAERFHSEVTFLHVQNPPGTDLNLSSDHETRNAKLLRDFVVAAFAHLNVKRIMRVGEPGSEIVAYAKQHGSDLIMMPTHEHVTLRRLLPGSIIASVLQDVDCPVWTGAHLAQGPPAEWMRPNTIVFGADAAPGSEKALAWAATLASELKTALILVHVEPRLESPGEGYYSRAYHEEMLAEAHRKMSELQRSAGTHAEVVISAGSVPHALCEKAGGLNADLLVIGRGHDAASQRLGLNTYGIIQESQCPVVSVRS